MNRKIIEQMTESLQLCASWIEDSVGECPVLDDDWEDGHSELSDALWAIKAGKSLLSNGKSVEDSLSEQCSYLEQISLSLNNLVELNMRKS